jgi:hypothetical protein
MVNSYQLKRRFKKTFNINGANYNFVREKGDIVQGEQIKDPNGEQYVRFWATFNNRKRRIIIPMSILTPISTSTNQAQSSFEGENTENNPTSIFTMSNVIMGLVGIAVVYGILKVTKVIK